VENNVDDLLIEFRYQFMLYILGKPLSR